jgi:aminoglycoside phosphotransferase
MPVDGDRAWFAERVRLVPADAGQPLIGAFLDTEQLIPTTAGALRRLHDTPLDGCPVTTTDDELLEEARLRVEHGVVDAASLDEAYRRHTPERLLEVARRTRPLSEPEAHLVHGRADLTTLRLVDGEPAWTDSARLGAGDRYRDLATFTIDLVARVSPQALGPFVDAYGVHHVDLVRLDFHVLLDQLLR